MRAFLIYNAARLGLFLVALGVLWMVGVGGLMLWALAFVISGIASYVLLSALRDKLSASVEGRVNRVRGKAGNLRTRLEEGAAAEDANADAEHATR